MAKKYLTLEEAADRLAMSKDELVKMRENGDVRGFADRGNWKFKVDDIDELARSRSADSDPDVPIRMEDDDSGFLDSGSELTLGSESGVVAETRSDAVLDDDDNFGSGLDASDSDVRLVMDSGVDAGESSLILGDADDSDSDISLLSNADSDSDVRLVAEDSDSDVKLVAEDNDSDSDVKLVDDDSDSDVKLVGQADSDSDIQLSPIDGPGIDEPTDSDVALVGHAGDSDSDIRLTPAEEDKDETDSDIRLVADEQDSGSDIALAPDFGSDSDVRLVADSEAEGSDSDVQLIDASSDLKTSDSDIALISSDDSAITLDLGQGAAPESVLGDESGIALAGDSSITLASESGISLEGPTDSGISLDLDMDDEGITLADDDDSGISLGDAGDSGIALAPAAQGGTQPMMDSVTGDEVAETQFEIPALSGEQSDFDIDALDEDGDTGVLDLQDSGSLDDAVFDVDDDESGELGDLSDELDLDGDFDDDSSMEDLDVFEDDDDFEDGFQSGESQGEMLIPSRAPAAETDWGTGPFVGLIVATCLLAMLGLVMADLVHSMWAWNEPNAVAGMMLGIFGGLF